MTAARTASATSKDLAPGLLIRFKKRPDAPASLALVRRDGSVTTGSIGAAAGYGPIHDLAHYVVEQTMGFGDAFLGLCADGWSLADFDRNASATIPDAAIWAECLAGELSREVMAGQPLGADDFNATVRASVARTPRPGGVAVPPLVSEAELEVLQSHVAALWEQWKSLPMGGTLECPFYPGERRRPSSMAK